MNDTLYKAEFSKAAEIWAQKNGYLSALQGLSDPVLEQLQNHDLLEVEIASGKTAIFSVIRKTVKLSASGQITIELLFDHPVR